MATISLQLRGLKLKKSNEYPRSQSFWYNIHGVHLFCELSYSQKSSFWGPWWPTLETLKKQITHASLWGSGGSFGIIYMGSIFSVSLARAQKIGGLWWPKLEPVKNKLHVHHHGVQAVLLI